MAYEFIPQFGQGPPLPSFPIIEGGKYAHLALDSSYHQDDTAAFFGFLLRDIDALYWRDDL